MRELVARAVRWHLGQLPARENLWSYVVHMSGPSLSELGRPTRFHTYACLFPELEQYVAMNTAEWPGCHINAVELRQAIADFEPPEAEVREIDELAFRNIGRVSSYEERWTVSVVAAASCRLPVACVVVGDTLGDDLRVVMLRAAVSAPLPTVMTELKRTAPNFSFN